MGFYFFQLLMKENRFAYFYFYRVYYDADNTVDSDIKIMCYTFKKILNNTTKCCAYDLIYLITQIKYEYFN